MFSVKKKKVKKKEKKKKKRKRKKKLLCQLVSCQQVDKVILLTTFKLLILYIFNGLYCENVKISLLFYVEKYT